MNLVVIEQNGQRVLTTQQLAEAYGTDMERIQVNFNRNKERYKEGKHFILLQGDELKQFKATYQIDNQLKFATKLYLWTEKGAWLHAKSLNTDEAWEAYERLVDEYYNVKENAVNLQMLSPQLQTLISLELRQKQLEKELEEAKKQVTVVQHRLDNIDRIDTIGDLRQRLNKMIQRYAHQNGIPFNHAWKDFVQAFNTAYRTNLELRRQNHINKTGKDISRPQFLEEMGLLDDAIRVADKMLNSKVK
ncbi:ORF6N domain-containing protein [Anoxybacillus kestanbolensis]|uniref:ORF6N domain-containing protein n=1 Tax=Anoxybacillus kestanbolensis TaxID=227476 RepID=UPI00208DB73E|nr:ORF6N domain-containing protein [Anoxybacillus kestanbolensis]MCL9969794.1 ORF6N domain-containing protein [Anoxybacillus kestanbolensis]